jgi:hypothetical protein
MRGILILSSLTIYEAYNFYLIYSMIPIISNTMDTHGLNIMNLNLVLLLLFLFGQFLGYISWYYIGLRTTGKKIIMAQLFMGIFINVILMLSINLYMLFIYRFLIGFCNMFVTIAVKYINDNPHDLEKKIHLIIIVVAWKLGQMLGIFVGNYVIDNRFMFLLIGSITLGIILSIMILNFVFSQVECVLQKIDDNESSGEQFVVNVLSIGETHDRINNHIFNDMTQANIKREPTSEHSDDYKDIFGKKIKYVVHNMFSIICDIKYILLMLSVSVLTSLSTTYTDILKIFFSLKNEKMELGYDSTTILILVILILVISNIIDGAILYLIKKITKKKFIGHAIFLMALVITYPYFISIEMNEFSKKVINVILNSVILGVFGVLIYIVHNEIYRIQSTKKMAFSYGLIKNFAMIFNVIFNALFTLVLNYTTYDYTTNQLNSTLNSMNLTTNSSAKPENNKYIDNTNAIFYVFAILVLIISCVFMYYKYVVNNSNSAEIDVDVSEDSDEEMDDKNGKSENTDTDRRKEADKITFMIYDS